MQPKAGTRPVVLIVEDEILVRMDAVEVIEGRGFEAVEARNADDAIAILDSAMTSVSSSPTSICRVQWTD